MENLHDVPTAVSVAPPSLLFWFKAGVGFGAGFVLIVAFSAAAYTTLILGLLAGVVSALGHSGPLGR